jgi:U3 small nucleolar RNA-associated protein 21
MHVSIVDLHADKRVRKISVSAKVTGIAWAEGGKWIAIATADKRMIVYDIATALVIDRVEFNSSVIALRFTHRNTQLITSHADGKGSIRVWQNVALLHGPGIVDTDFYKIDEIQDERKRELVDVSHNSKKQKTIAYNAGQDEVVLYGGSKWQQILKLDDIKERNKPKRPADKPKSAPFFLPIKYQGVQPVFAAPVDDLLTSDGLKEEVRSGEKSAQHAGFSALLIKKKWLEVESHLMNLSASGIHICLAELEDDDSALRGFIEYLAAKTASGHNIDLTATLTSLFLKAYGSSLKGRSTFQRALQQLSTAAKQRQERFEYETDQLQCLVKVSAALQLHR